MWKHLQLLLSILSFMAFTTDPSPDDDPDDDPDEKNPPSNDPPADRSTWTVEQWTKEIQRIAAKENDKGRKAAEREYQKQKDDADAAAELAKQESEGKYEEAKQKLTSDLESAQTARDQALELLKATVDAQWGELPEAVRNTFTGDEDDVLAKSAFVQQMKPIIDELSKGNESKPPRGNHGNPTPGQPNPEKTPPTLTSRTAF